MRRLKKEYLELVKNNPQLMGTIAQNMGVDKPLHIKTVERWLIANHEKLTSPTVLKCIRKFAKLGDEIELTYETNGVVKA